VRPSTHSVAHHNKSGTLDCLRNQAITLKTPVQSNALLKACSATRLRRIKHLQADSTTINGGRAGIRQSLCAELCAESSVPCVVVRFLFSVSSPKPTLATGLPDFRVKDRVPR
jgi:hypothetical protein